MDRVALIAVVVLVALGGVAVGYLLHDPGTETTVIERAAPKKQPCANKYSDTCIGGYELP